MGDCMGRMMGGPMISMTPGGGSVGLLLIAVPGLSVAALVEYPRRPE